jgi:hypothetical protein
MSLSTPHSPQPVEVLSLAIVDVTVLPSYTLKMEGETERNNPQGSINVKVRGNI